MGWASPSLESTVSMPSSISPVSTGSRTTGGVGSPVTVIRACLDWGCSAPKSSTKALNIYPSNLTYANATLIPSVNNCHSTTLVVLTIRNSTDPMRLPWSLTACGFRASPASMTTQFLKR